MMRILPAFIGALIITLAVFVFMQSLITRGQNESVQVVTYQDVQIWQDEPEKPLEQEEPEPELREEPTLEPLDILTVSPPTPEPIAEMSIATLDLGVGDINVGAVGARWSAPLGAGKVEVSGGQDAQGFIEVVPYDTRRPNVPEVAWQNKIDGWVLVAFSVTRQGKTRNARVLDARPRGVFEEKVLAAVADWSYRIKVTGGAKGTVVLTQKVEVQWKNFPHNLPNVD
jgi:protein TonB